MVGSLLKLSSEFRTAWNLHEVGLLPQETKHFMHPELGELALNCQTLLDPDGFHSLLVYTAAPGSESAQKLRLLAVLGSQATRPDLGSRTPTDYRLGHHLLR